MVIIGCYNFYRVCVIFIWRLIKRDILKKNKGKINERKSFFLKYCYLWFVFEIIESVFLYFVFNNEKFVLRKEIFRFFVRDF